MAKRIEPHWTAADQALLFTCAVAADLAGGIIPETVPSMCPPWAPQLGSHEVFLAYGPYREWSFRPLGDGSYVGTSTFAFGSPLFVGGMLAANAIGNANRRARASADAVPRWMPVASGEFAVSDQGMYFRSAGLGTWMWSQVAAMCMISRGRVDLTPANGAKAFVVESPWAELAFVVWALRVHPNHPQLLSGGWLPPGWSEWARAQGREPTPVRRRIGGA
jgi:hypothetical protein